MVQQKQGSSRTTFTSGNGDAATRQLWASYRLARAQMLRVRRLLQRLQPEGLAEKLQNRQHRVIELRNALAEHYLPLVTRTAGRLHPKLPGHVELDDLVAQGSLGLLRAIEQFRPQRGVRFATFAPSRIHGAILDALRDLDWAPRTVRTRVKQRHRAKESFYKAHGRDPSDGELVEILTDRFVLQEIEVPDVTSLDSPIHGRFGDDTTRKADMIHDPHAVLPAQGAEYKDIKDFVTRHLSRSERLIVLLYYGEQMTMKEIGATLDLSESRVSQMHSSVKQRLQARLYACRHEWFPALRHA